MIGDVLTSSILCEALKKRFNDCEVHFIINKNTLPVLEGNPFIDEKIVYTPEVAGNRKLQRELRKQLKRQNYDAVIDVYSKLGSARLARSTKAPIIIGQKKWYTKGFYTHLFRNHIVPKTSAGLAIENRMKMLRALDDDFPIELKPKMYLKEEEIAFAKAELKTHHIASDRPLFMISVLGSSQEKTYPLNYLSQILDHLVIKTNAQLLLNYIPNQRPEVDKLLDLCSEKTRNHINSELYGKSLREFIALASQCDAVIGNEGGAINMAKAVDTPTFAIFSPWIRKEAWALYTNSQNHVVHLSDLSPEIYKKRSLKSIKKEVDTYYKLITPEYVITYLDQFLKENGY